MSTRTCSKFSSGLEEYLHNLSLVADEGIGSVFELNHYSRVDAPLLDENSHFYKPEDFDEDDKQELEKIKGGVIIEEDDAGFLYFQYFDDKESLLQAWNRIEVMYEDFYESVEKEDC